MNMAGLMLFVVAVAIGILSVIIRGYVLLFMYQWFVQGPFNGPNLTVPIAIGIALLITYTVNPVPKSRQKLVEENGKLKIAPEHIGENRSQAILFPIIVLVIAYIVKQFI